MSNPQRITTESARHANALAPEYELEREIGRGGMAVVYLAREPMLDRMVAVKVLTESAAGTSDFRARFLREAQTAAGLVHPLIVPVYRAAELGGVVFFVMRYIDGESLAERAAARGRLPMGEVVRVLIDVATALDYASRNGVVHRDVKPENILMERGSGRALVTDFGIARVAQAAPRNQTKNLLGTVHYVSPEQAQGLPVDGRSDLYALGVVGFWLLTGQFPIDDVVDLALIRKHVHTPALTVRSLAPHVPKRLAALIDQCLLKDPAARPESGAALAAALGWVLQELTQAGQPGGVGTDEPVSGTGSTHPGGTDEVVLSAREARAVWSRAAALHEATGSLGPFVLPSVPPGDGSGDADGKRSLTSGYPLAYVRAAGKEAGIGSSAMERAIEEMRQSGRRSGGDPGASRSSTGPALIETYEAPASRWYGAPMTISYQLHLSRELSAQECHEVVETIERTFNGVGERRPKAGAVAWSSSPAKGRRLQALIQWGEGSSTIRVDEELEGLARQVFGWLVGCVGLGSLGPMLMIGSDQMMFMRPMGIWVASVCGMYVVARRGFGWMRAGRDRELRGLMKALVGQVARQ